MPKALSNIDRKTAGRLLGVSVRTIDRYIRGGKLPARELRGRIWLSRKDILEFRRSEGMPVKTANDRNGFVTTRPSTTVKEDTSFYRDLYEEAKRALGDYQQKLEQANYRIGQLESHSVHPAASLKTIERRDDFSGNDFLRRELAEREKEISVLKDLVKRERASRIIFAILTYLLLILQPIFWYFLR